MRARARVVAECDGDGVTRLSCLRSEAPLALRATSGSVYLVGGAGGPLGGDDLTVEVVVGPGARLTVRTAAASIALPGPGPGPSYVRVRAEVACGGELWWLPEPLVAARGCEHRMEATVVLEEGAWLLWREETVLGRHGEEPGSVLTRTTVDLGGAPLLRHELALGPGHPGGATPAVVAGARAVGTVLLVDTELSPPPHPLLLGLTGAVLPLARAGVQAIAVAGDPADLRRQLKAWTPTLRSNTRQPPAP